MAASIALVTPPSLHHFSLKLAALRLLECPRKSYLYVMWSSLGFLYRQYIRDYLL